MILLYSLENWKTTFEIIESITKVLALVIGGIWTYNKFIRQRENQPLIDFSVDIVFHTHQKDYWIVELNAYIENKGKVQHKVHEFSFELASLEAIDEIVLNAKYENQVNFPHILTKGSFLSHGCTYFFNEPGLKNKYSHITRVPIGTKVLLMHSWFKYLDGINSHVAEVTKKVPSIELIKEN